MLTIVWRSAWLGHDTPEHAERVDVLAMYWHFVDVGLGRRVHRRLRHRTLTTEKQTA